MQHTNTFCGQNVGSYISRTFANMYDGHGSWSILQELREGLGANKIHISSPEINYSLPNAR
jgi:hypothetical protein